MKTFKILPVLIAIGLYSTSCSVSKNIRASLNKTKWIHGAANCKQNKDEAIQVVQLNTNTWILRQNKCINYEAPFMFLFAGEKKALLMDTGATEDSSLFPLYETVAKLLTPTAKAGSRALELIVAHTHAHGDHIAGDIQFKNKPNTKVVGLNVEDVTSVFNIKNWPVENGSIDLGNRLLEIIPIPGHQQASIAVYDTETNILLTGDSFYPGRLYIRDWPAFVVSTQRLLDFATNHKVSYLLGNHIEMTTTPGKDYVTGTTYQPDEHALPLKITELAELNNALKKLGDKPAKETHDSFIIYPK
ncbi:MAG: MBL fold metallo-hydrolase [Chitinophagaceae bacterium]|nr:MBL fold metallo-hydrolase [Chitinophagaceae bacterium]